MIMLFLMSYSLLCCSTNDPPWHPRRLWTAPTPGWCISNLSGVCAALGEVLVSQVFNKPFWGHEDGAWRSELRLAHPSPSHACSIPSRDPSPMSLEPSPIILLILPPLHALVQPISVASSPIIRPHSTLLHLPRSACFALRSAPPPLLQHMPGLLGHRLHSEDFIWKSSSGRHYKDHHHRALWLMLH